MANLETLHGVKVSVADEKVERLLATGGYRRPGESDKKPARRKATSTTEK